MTLISAAEAAKISESAQPSTLEELKQEVGVFIYFSYRKRTERNDFHLIKIKSYNGSSQ
ncbi:hypothetical protein ACNKGN_00175 [Acinetobacter baumannii]